MAFVFLVLKVSPIGKIYTSKYSILRLPKYVYFSFTRFDVGCHVSRLDVIPDVQNISHLNEE